MASWHMLFRGDFPDINSPVAFRLYARDWVIERDLRKICNATGMPYWAAGILEEYIIVCPQAKKPRTEETKNVYRRKQHPIFELFKHESSANKAD